MMPRALLAAVSEVNTCALRVKVFGRLDKNIIERLQRARLVLGDHHPISGDVDYFLLICASASIGTDDGDDQKDQRDIRQAKRLLDSVQRYLSNLGSAPRDAGRDLGRIYG
jgi:hypothetical protein